MTSWLLTKPRSTGMRVSVLSLRIAEPVQNLEKSAIFSHEG